MRSHNHAALPCSIVNLNSTGRSFTSIQMFHTHTHALWGFAHRRYPKGCCFSQNVARLLCCCCCRCRCGCGCGCCCCYPCSSFISLLVAKNRPQVVFPRFFETPGANTHCKHRSLLRRRNPKAWYVRTFSFATVNKIAVFTFFCKRRAKTLVFQHVARSISWVERVR